MAKGTKTPRGKRGHRSKSPAVTTQPKRRRVIKQKKKITVKETLHKTRKHGMKTRANAQQPDHADCNVQNSQLIEDERPQPPSTPKTPHTSNSIWHLLNPYRSFWDLIKISYDDTNGSKSSTPKEDDIQAIMDRLNRQVSHQFDSYKYEDSGFFSSSPSGDDPRDEMPVDEAEVDDLRVAIWPTLQHVAELTKSHPLVPDPEDDYLTQLRYVREQLRDTWQNKGFPGNPPPTFQLEAWNGGIANWRSSFYTNGEDRFPASHVEAQTEVWRAEAPSTPVNDISTSSDDEGASANEIYHAARHEFGHNNTSPSLGHRNNRPVMAALYDASRDIGLPTPAQIQSYQAGVTPTITIPSNSMTDTGMSSPTNELMLLPSRKRIYIFEDQHTPPPSSDDPPAFSNNEDMSPSSNKENDTEALIRIEREERAVREREQTPSSSQNVINPVGERMARSERLGEEWEMEREWGG